MYRRSACPHSTHASEDVSDLRLTTGSPEARDLMRDYLVQTCDGVLLVAEIPTDILQGTLQHNLVTMSPNADYTVEALRERMRIELLARTLGL